MPKLPTVELFPAHVWTCTRCGRDNYIRCIIVPPESNQHQELVRLAFDLAPDDPIPEDVADVMITKESVVCQYCQAPYRAIFEKEEDSDDGPVQ